MEDFEDYKDYKDYMNFDSSDPLLNFVQNEETLDVAEANIMNQKVDIPEDCDESLNNLVLFPMDPIGAPARGNFDGSLQFEVTINDTNKKKYLFSHKLNRVYVQMAAEFSLQFKWDFAKVPNPTDRYYVRATTVFSDAGMWEQKVERCVGHMYAKDETNNDIKEHMIKHVLRSARNPNSEGVWYCGSAVNPQSWLSVMVSFPSVPETGSVAFPHAYYFVCKNTCPGGINRRDIEVIFTLENQLGQVLGRQSIGACISSCPKRDIKNHEQNVTTRKRRTGDASDIAPPSNKKVKKEISEPAGNVDTTMFAFKPDVKIMGRRGYETILNVCLNTVTADSVRLSSLGQPVPQDCTNAISTFQRMLDELNITRNS